MASAMDEAVVSYEELADLEKDFDVVEVEIIRQQAKLSAPLYERRAKIVSQIPNFWPLVLEQAPPDIDQYITPSDSAILLSSLVSLSVSHFELDADPRSVSITFTFAPNEYFTNEVLEKKFWWRKSKDGWGGLVSEPVKIDWKESSKDPTGGLLDMVVKAWEQDKGKVSGKLTSEQEALTKRIETIAMGGLSFFGWFGFAGRRISAEESVEATEREAKAMADRKAGKKSDACCDHDHSDGHTHDDENQQSEDDLDLEMSLEIFPDGDDLAVAFAEDLWPGAIKYFTQAQEQDAMSDVDFESDAESADGSDAPELVEQGDSDEEDEQPRKKQRAS